MGESQTAHRPKGTSVGGQLGSAPVTMARVRRRTTTLAVLAGFGLLAAACSSGGGAAKPGTTTSAASTTTAAPPPTTAPLAALPAPDAVAVAAAGATAATCDALDTRACMLPYPSNQFTKADPAAATKLRLAIDPAATPKNAAGKAIDPAEWNTGDGFSPASSLLTFVPGLDLAASAVATVDNIAASSAPSSPIVLLDTTSFSGVQTWAELDANTTQAGDRLLVIHPATTLVDGHHYVVGLRNLKAAGGAPIAAAAVFRAYRDRFDTGVPALEARRSAMEATFGSLTAAGIDRASLYLAWDFTVASSASLSGRVLKMRDETFTALAGKAPVVAITAVSDPADKLVGREIEGTLTVANYLAGDGSPGQRFALGADGLPAVNGTRQVPFLCAVPEADFNGTTAARVIVFGHDLFGAKEDLRQPATVRMMQENRMVFCAVDEIGLAGSDVPFVASTASDVSLFPAVADRLQQGMLNTIVLARALRARDGLVLNKAFLRDDGTPLVDNTRLYFLGQGEGGTIGLATSAVSPDWDRVLADESGLDHATMMWRSVAYQPLLGLIGKAYPNQVDRMLAVSMMQVVWDRGEASGYANHITSNPLSGAGQKRVLLRMAFGDHQVANVSTLQLARSLKASLLAPPLAAGRWPQADPFSGLPVITNFPWDSTGLIVWDSGAVAPPSTNTPGTAGHDPHGDVTASFAARTQGSDWLKPSGRVAQNTCLSAPCVTAPAG